jgi:hypothetical protein
MMRLVEPTLGTLDLECGTGFVVSSFEIGWPTVRQVVTARALSDGTIDTTRYLGARAVTVALRLDQRVLATQDLLDMVTPFLSPRYRPTLVWEVQPNPAPGCDVTVPPPAYPVRSLMVRGADAPLVIDGPRYVTIVCQWVAQESYTSGLEETCAVASVTGTEEDGRTYDLDFDRDYPFSPVYGFTFFNTNGNAPMDWTATLTAEITDPEILVNDTTITFTGLTLTAGQTVEFNTQDRTILRNGDPLDSVYGFTNFADWTWDDLRLVPGTNKIRLQGSATVGDPAFTLCWFDKWFV